MAESAIDIDNIAVNTSSVNSTRSILVSELACYIACKFGKLSETKLGSIINDFYSPDHICEAKKMLVDAIEALGVAKWVKPPNRKQSENKSKLEVTDILNLYSFASDNHILDILPMFVAANVDNLPTARMEEGDLGCVLNKLDTIADKIDSFGKTVPDKILSRLSIMDTKLDILKLNKPDNNSKSNKGSSSSSEMVPLQTPSGSGCIQTPIPRGPGMTENYANNGSTVSGSWADRTATPLTVRRNPALGNGSVDTDTDDNHGMGSDGFTVVKSKKRRIGSDQNSKSASRSAPVQRVIGSNVTTCTLKAAKELKKSKIFCVSNLSKDTTCADLLQWLNDCNIKINNIFEAKTKYANSTSFRVNIDAMDENKFTANDIWASHIIVREWVFKSKLSQ